MNELSLAVYTGKDNVNSVTLTAKFASQDDAIKFHAAIAELCRSTVPSDSIPWSLKRLMLVNASKRD
jgi:hypothetical protein